jgi:hypothetical protein
MLFQLMKCIHVMQHSICKYRTYDQHTSELEFEISNVRLKSSFRSNSRFHGVEFFTGYVIKTSVRIVRVCIQSYKILFSSKFFENRVLHCQFKNLSFLFEQKWQHIIKIYSFSNKFTQQNILKVFSIFNISTCRGTTSSSQFDLV